jgi:hypothetical protein
LRADWIAFQDRLNTCLPETVVGLTQGDVVSNMIGQFHTSSSHLVPIGERLEHRNFIGILEVTPDR